MINTFDRLMKEPAAERVFLAELKPGELLAGWSLTGGQSNTYEISYLNETITLADGSVELFRKALVDLKENGASLTEQASIANVEANPGSWWHDTANSLLYVHPSGSDAPENYTLIGYFWLNLATKGIVLNDKYYAPFIYQKGIPSLKIGNPDVYWGITQISGGSLSLMNNTGYFDQIFKRWLWINKPCRLLMGGEQLPYSEYKLLRTHIIVDKNFKEREVIEFELRPKAHDFYRKVPTEVFTTDVYSNMEPDLEGDPIPIIYGLCHSHEAVPAYCIERSLGAGDEWRMKVAGHAIHSFMQAYVMYDQDVGWETLAMDSSSLGDATFIFTSGSYQPRDDVKVAMVGVASGNGYLTLAPHIMEHFLTTYCNVATADINSYHLAASLTKTEANLAVPIIDETEAIDVIDKICKSDLAFFDEDETGKFRYRTWQPYLATSFTTLDKHELTKYSIKDETEQLFWRVKVGYRNNPLEDEYLYAVEVNSASRFKYDQAETLVHDTYIQDASDAQRLAQRLLLLMRDPSPQGRFEVKATVIDKLLGDQIKVTLARSPFETAGGWNLRRFELSRLDLSFFPVKTKMQAFDLKEFGGGVGFWTSTVGVTSYGGATEDERGQWGFWTSTLGFADPTDDDSLNPSLWW